MFTTTANQKNAEKKASDAANKFDSAADSIKGAAKDAKESARSGLKAVESGLTDIANDAGKRVRSLIESASDELNNASSRAKNEIRKNPLQSGAIIAGVAFVLGALFARK